MTLYRCFAWDERASETGPDGPLWFPRPFQGDGRHDNPELCGCLYLADRAVSSVVEQLARFRGQRLTTSLLQRRGLPLALARLKLDGAAELIDLDDPAVLKRERLRPSSVATRNREVTQLKARRLHQHRKNAAGLRWWSTYEALWTHVTLFDRAADQLALESVRPLALTTDSAREAAEHLGLGSTP